MIYHFLGLIYQVPGRAIHEGKSLEAGINLNNIHLEL